MALCSISTVNSVNIKSISKPPAPLPNYFYSFTNSSVLSCGYILNSSSGLYDLSAINITTSNFFANGIYLPASPSTYCLLNSITTSNYFTIVQKYTKSANTDNRLFTIRNVTNNTGFNIRLSGSGLVGQHIQSNNTAYGTSGLINTNNTDTLVCVYSASNYMCYTNANSAGVSFGNDYTNNNYGNTMRVAIGVWWYPDVAAGSNYSAADNTQLVNLFRFYNRAFTSTEITNALAGTYPSS